MLEAYTGRPGAGKTYSMIARALGEHKKNRPIYSNMGLTWATEFQDWQQLIETENCLCLIDEIGIWFNARSWQTIPREVLSYFSQSRKRGVDIWYTVQMFDALDKQIRGLTAVQWECQRYGPFILSTARDPQEQGKNGKRASLGWRIAPLREVVYRSYDTHEIIQFGDGQGKSLGPAGERRVARRLDYLCQNGYVRVVNEYDVVRYRLVTVVDLLTSDFPVLVKQGGRFRLEDTSDLDLWRRITLSREQLVDEEVNRVSAKETLWAVV